MGKIYEKFNKTSTTKFVSETNFLFKFAISHIEAKQSRVNLLYYFVSCTIIWMQKCISALSKYFLGVNFQKKECIRELYSHVLSHS